MVVFGAAVAKFPMQPNRNSLQELKFIKLGVTTDVASQLPYHKKLL